MKSSLLNSNSAFIPSPDAPQVFLKHFCNDYITCVCDDPFLLNSEVCHTQLCKTFEMAKLNSTDSVIILDDWLTIDSSLITLFLGRGHKKKWELQRVTLEAILSKSKICLPDAWGNALTSPHWILCVLNFMKWVTFLASFILLGNF